MNIILDACAVIAFFRDEEGADLVRETITNKNNNSMIHRVTSLEIKMSCLPQGNWVRTN
jgi:PIN domain nuclease of toxin-antitoxin system